MINNFINKKYYTKISKLIFSRKNKSKFSSIYWSNLSEEENSILLKTLKKNKTNHAIKLFPKKNYLKKVIFSTSRAIGLKILKLQGKELAIDFGCMWGALTIPLALKVKKVLGIDQTIQSLFFLEKRVKENKIKNILLVQDNLRQISLKKKSFDLAVVNGVLEWIGETNNVVVEKYVRHSKKLYVDKKKPIVHQITFLKKIFSGLKKKGKLYLAIENRYDYKMFFGLRDPHSGLFFTSIMPKSIANITSLIFRKRKYNTWIYSKNELCKILNKAGFKNVTFYSAWPDYRFPKQIYKYDSNLGNFSSPFLLKKQNFRRKIASILEKILFNIFNLHFFAPSFIIVAKKN